MIFLNKIKVTQATLNKEKSNPRKWVKLPVKYIY